MSNATVNPPASAATLAKTSTRTSTVSEHEQNPRRWWILAILGIAQLMVVLDGTVVNIALPSAQADLGFSDGNRQWIITAYALAFGSLLLLGGRLADLFGRKRIFIIGLVGFAAASAIGGAATGFGMLVVARAVQGVFGALLAPAALSLLTTTFTDPKERGRAFGIFGAIAGGGAAIGLLLGGVLTEYLDWRWTMYVNIIFAVPAVIGAVMLLGRTISEHRPRLDIPGTITVSAGLFLLVYGFSHAETGGWGSALTVSFLIGSVVLLAIFVMIQRRAAHPLLPLRIILDRTRGGGYLAMLLAATGMFGVFLFLTYYLQSNLGYSAVQTGLVFLPMCFVLVVVAAAGSAVLSTRVSPKLLIPVGMALGAIAMVLLTRLDVNSSYAADMLPSLLLLGAGLGLIFSTGMSIATLGVDKDDAGVASAAVNTMQQVGGAVGTALLNTLAATAAASFLVGREPNAANLELAQIHSYTTAFWWAAGFFALGAVLCGLVLRPGVPQSDPDAEPVLAI